jgi:hypothetical protein
VEGLKAYFDDSGDDDHRRHNAFVLAGYVGTAEAWAMFEALFREALDWHGVPYLHMKQLAHRLPPYEKWKADDGGRIAFLRDVVNAIGQAKLAGLGSLIRIKDLRRFNDEKGLKIDPTSFALYANLIELRAKYPDQSIEIIIDRVNGAASRIAMAKTYAATDTYYPGCGENVIIRALTGDHTFRNVLPMQAADFAAYELRKDNETNTEFFSDVLPTIDPKDMMARFLFWQLHKYGKATWPPTRRKSLDALSRAAHIEGGVWHHAMFVAADMIRNGIWPFQG